MELGSFPDTLSATTTVSGPKAPVPPLPLHLRPSLLKQLTSLEITKSEVTVSSFHMNPGHWSPLQREMQLPAVGTAASSISESGSGCSLFRAGAQQ